jgi:hypothetical protein
MLQMDAHGTDGAARKQQAALVILVILLVKQ